MLRDSLGSERSRVPWVTRLEQLVPVTLYAALAVLMLLHAHRYASFLSDDALISLRYARRLVEGHGLSWTGNERVEGYTDLGWVLLTAAGRRLGLDYIAAAILLDKIGVLTALAVVGWSPQTGRLSASRLLLGGSLLVATVPMAVWTQGALEHGFMAGVLAFAIYRLQRANVIEGDGRAWSCGLALAALMLLRADGAVLVSLALAGALVPAALARDRARVRWFLEAAIAPAAALVGQGLFRRLYYGQWLPQTALVKVAFNRTRVALGFGHLAHGYAAAIVLVVVAIVATVLLVRRRHHAVLLVPWSVALGWALYLAAVGGDIFPGWRQLLLGLVPLCMIAAGLGEQIGGRCEWRRMILLLPLSVGLASLHLHLQLLDGENQRAAHEVWEWDGLSIGPMLKRAFGEAQPLLAVDAAGALPYWSELPSLDMLGLNDSYIAHHPPSHFGQGPIGHELGDGVYVLGRAPDLIAFDNAAGARDPAFLSGRQMLERPGFYDQYQWVRLQGSTGNRALGELWVRRVGRIGVVRQADRIEIPGFLFTGQASYAAAHLDARGALVAEVSADLPGVLPAFEFPAGRWRIEALTAGGAIVLGLRCNGRTAQGIAPGSRLLVDLDRPTPLEIAAAPPVDAAGVSELARVVFTRATESAARIGCDATPRRLTAPLAWLSRPKPEGLTWDHPTNFVIGPEGLALEVATSQRVRHIDLSADENDTYAIEIIHGGASSWRGEVPPHPNRGGLALHRIDLPAPTTVSPNDKIVVTPLSGDGRYSIGDLRLSE